MNATKRILARTLAGAFLLISLAGCASRITKVKHYDDGTIVVTGVREVFLGTRGFLWVGKYDAATRILTVEEYRD